MLEVFTSSFDNILAIKYGMPFDSFVIHLFEERCDPGLRLKGTGQAETLDG